tara:strand:- start:326 stop:1075 length:750 start_codon:yes stop_codon:yes gene_type:complete
MKKQNTLTDKTYRLKLDAAPLTYILPTRHTRRSSLLYFDTKTNSNRALRYASNQKSPFEDEQDGNVVLEPVIFEDGFLTVKATNPILQEFLYLHPHRDRVYEEVNEEKEAKADIASLEVEVDALIAAKQLSLSQLEMVNKVLFGTNVDTVSTAELKRDVLVYARREPQHFLEVLNDPQLTLNAQVNTFFEKGLLKFRNNRKDIFYNTLSSKKKMLTVPFGEDPYYVASSYLQSEEGIDALKMLESNLED